MGLYVATSLTAVYLIVGILLALLMERKFHARP